MHNPFDYGSYPNGYSSYSPGYHVETDKALLSVMFI